MKRIIISIILSLSLGTPAWAQSIGGGLGGDRGVFLTTKRPVVVDAKTLTCDELQGLIQSEGRVRLNFRTKKVEGYQVIFSRSALFCGNARNIQRPMIETKDEKQCYAGFICVGTFL